MNELVIQLDRPIETFTLRRALSHALAVEPDQISIITDAQYKSGAAWIPPTAIVGVKTTRYGGDFPMELDIAVRQDADVRHVMRVVAGDTGAATLTDQFEHSSPSGTVWLLIAPGGAERVVHADPDAFADTEDPGIVLLPEFRDLLETHRMASTHAS
jgi:hypothetical protein